MRKISVTIIFKYWDIFLIAPAGFWPRGQNPRRHITSPRTYKGEWFGILFVLVEKISIYQLGAQLDIGIAKPCLIIFMSH